MVIQGSDPYAGTSYGIEINEYPVHIGLTVDGCNGNNTVLITPDQAIALGNALVRKGQKMSDDVRKCLDPKEKS